MVLGGTAYVLLVIQGAMEASAPTCKSGLKETRRGVNSYLTFDYRPRTAVLDTMACKHQQSVVAEALVPTVCKALAHATATKATLEPTAQIAPRDISPMVVCARAHALGQTVTAVTVGVAWHLVAGSLAAARRAGQLSKSWFSLKHTDRASTPIFTKLFAFHLVIPVPALCVPQTTMVLIPKIHAKSALATSTVGSAALVMMVMVRARALLPPARATSAVQLATR